MIHHCNSCQLSVLSLNRLDFTGGLLQSYQPKHLKHTCIHAALLIVNYCAVLFLSQTVCSSCVALRLHFVCVTASYFSNIKVLSLFVNSATLLPVHLSMFAKCCQCHPFTFEHTEKTQC